MLRRLIVLAVALVFSLMLSPAWAGVAAVPAFTGDSETMASIGLRFDFGDMRPEIVGAVRHTNTNSNNNVTGVMGEIAFPVTGEQPFVPTVRALGIVGVPDVQGLAGVGYDFAAGQALVGAGAQGPFVEGGIDLYLDGALHPYIGVNSYDGAPDRNLVLVAPP